MICIYLRNPPSPFCLTRVQDIAVWQARCCSCNQALATPAPPWAAAEQWILRLSVRCHFTLRERLYKAFRTTEHRVEKSWISDATLARRLRRWKHSGFWIFTSAKQRASTSRNFSIFPSPATWIYHGQATVCRNNNISPLAISSGPEWMIRYLDYCVITCATLQTNWTNVFLSHVSTTTPAPSVYSPALTPPSLSPSSLLSNLSNLPPMHFYLAPP